MRIINGQMKNKSETSRKIKELDSYGNVVYVDVGLCKLYIPLFEKQSDPYSILSGNGLTYVTWFTQAERN